MTTERSSNRNRTAQEVEDEKAVRSVPLDTEDGGTVVIEQQNMGGAQQVGGGEYKNVAGGKTVEAAAEEQEQLDREAPIADHSEPAEDADGGAK